MLCALLLVLGQPKTLMHTLVQDNLERWLVTVRPSGFFSPRLDRRWRPHPKQEATLVSQSRLLFNFAHAYTLTKDTRYLRATQSGADFLLRAFSDAGGFYWSLHSNGRPQAKHKSTYGHAFVMLGLSRAFEVTQDPRHLKGAKRAWQTVERRLVDDHSGYVQRKSRDFGRAARGRSQNPLMHLFEGLLALHRASKEPLYLEEATILADFVLSRLYNPRQRAIPELFDERWRPKNSYIDVGHQFEWAFLLSEAVAQGAPRRLLGRARTLLQTGMRLGYDSNQGGVFSRADMEGKTLRGPKTWWPQCEHLRAMMRFARRHDMKELEPSLQRSWAFFQARFVDPEHGGVFEQEGKPGDKGSIRKVGYHVTGLYLEALAR